MTFLKKHFGIWKKFEDYNCVTKSSMYLPIVPIYRIKQYPESYNSLLFIVIRNTRFVIWVFDFRLQILDFK